MKRKSYYTYTLLVCCSILIVLCAPAWSQESLVDRVVPAGAVMAFNLKKCPKRWKPYAPAEGRFVLGADRDNEINIPGGDFKFTLSKNQLPLHSHSVSISGGSNTNFFIAKSPHGDSGDIGNIFMGVDTGGDRRPVSNKSWPG